MNPNKTRSFMNELDLKKNENWSEPNPSNLIGLNPKFNQNQHP